jgi:hypothetical protein
MLADKKGGEEMSFRVFKAVGSTLAFPFQHAIDVLRVVWLPAVLQVAGYFLLMPGYLEAATMMGADPPADSAETWSRLSPFVFQALLFLVISVALTVIMFNGLTRLVVKGEKPSAPFLLRWRADEWRVLAGWVLFALILAALQVAVLVGGFVIQGIMALGPGPGVILSVLVSLIVLLIGIWICVRLSLLVPATLAEQKIGLGSSWERTEDDFWSLLGFWLIFVIVSVILQLMLAGFLTPPGYFEAFQSAGFGSPEAMRDATRKANEIMAKGYDLSDSGNITRMLVGYLISIAATIFMAIAGAVCWRQMTEAPADESATP